MSVESFVVCTGRIVVSFFVSLSHVNFFNVTHISVFGCFWVVWVIVRKQKGMNRRESFGWTMSGYLRTMFRCKLGSTCVPGEVTLRKGKMQNVLLDQVTLGRLDFRPAYPS